MPTFGGIVVATGSEASGRRTLLDVVDELARPVDASDTTVRALAGDAFRAAVRTLNRRGLWPWEILDEDVTITANDRFSSVTSAIKKPLAMHLLNVAGGVRDRRIAYEPYNRFVETLNQNISGEPHTYTIPNLFETGQILWFPTPTSADDARLTFYRMTPAPKAETETIEIPDYALEAYMAYARFELSKRLPAFASMLPYVNARDDARAAFKELSAHVNAPSDTSRDLMGY